MTTISAIQAESATIRVRYFFIGYVRDQVSPLDFGIRACSAGEMPKVPKAWGLTASL